MKILSPGTIYKFECPSCGCIFLEGINNIADHGFFYKASCPMCGAECRGKEEIKNDNQRENDSLSKEYREVNC